MTQELIKLLSDFVEDPIILVAVMSLTVGLTRFLDYFISRGKAPKGDSYGKRLAALTNNLSKASSEVDTLLDEIAKVAKDRETAVQQLEAQLKKLEQDEKELQKKVQDLQKVPVPVAEHFASIIRQEEKRSAWRDYILFGLGVVVSTIIAIVLKKVGLG